MIVSIRNRLYDRGIFSDRKCQAVVISVGNIVVGGTGKTPMVEYLVSFWMKRGRKVAVISRGYKRASGGSVSVRGGKAERGDASTLGDEPFQIARKFPSVTVIVDENRVNAAFEAVKLGAEIIIMDDGFQHRKLHRDVDIVMLDSHQSSRETPLLPAGRRRDVLASARRAHVIASPAGDSRPDLSGLAPGAVPVSVAFFPVRVRGLNALDSQPIESLKGVRSVCFCGIARPESFKKTAETLGVTIESFLTFPDHHVFSASDLEKISRAMRRTGAEILFTTEKDAVRLIGRRWPGDQAPPIFYPEIAVKILEGEQPFHRLLESHWNNRSVC